MRLKTFSTRSDQALLSALAGGTMLATLVVLGASRMALGQGTTNCNPPVVYQNVCPNNAVPPCANVDCAGWTTTFGNNSTPPPCTSTPTPGTPATNFKRTAAPTSWTLCTGGAGTTTGTSTRTCTLSLAHCGVWELFIDPTNPNGNQTCNMSCGTTNQNGYCKAQTGSNCN